MKVKLVRDKLEARHSLETIKAANSAAGKMMGLYLKLHEEAAEIADAPHNPEEYADLLQVIVELMHMNNISPTDVERIMHEKRADKGGLSRGRILVRHQTHASRVRHA